MLAKITVKIKQFICHLESAFSNYHHEGVKRRRISKTKKIGEVLNTSPRG